MDEAATHEFTDQPGDTVRMLKAHAMAMGPVCVLHCCLSQFSIFGIPKMVKLDQGSNFMSCMFAEVLRQLNVKHNKASAYPLNGSNQMLKSLLRSCWDMTGRKAYPGCC